jgi:hypothetical protein
LLERFLIVFFFSILNTDEKKKQKIECFVFLNNKFTVLYSHSVVAGGFDVRSYKIRLIPGTFVLIV